MLINEDVVAVESVFSIKKFLEEILVNNEFRVTPPSPSVSSATIVFMEARLGKVAGKNPMEP